MRISDYFTLKEIQCGCGCGFAKMNEDTLAAADAIRKHVGHPVNCGSGCRCVEHNHNIGGAKLSRHLPRHVQDNIFEADGMDLHLFSEEVNEVIEYLEINFPNVSFIKYEWGLHIDCRPEPFYKRA